MERFDLPVSLRIKKPSSEVYKAWTTPAQVSPWLCDRMDGEWATGKVVCWRFGDASQEIRVIEATPGKRLLFAWAEGGAADETEVEVLFEDLGGETRVLLRERDWAMNSEAVRLALDHACGWENLLCRLKAWVEYGVSLR